MSSSSASSIFFFFNNNNNNNNNYSSSIIIINTLLLIVILLAYLSSSLLDSSILLVSAQSNNNNNNYIDPLLYPIHYVSCGDNDGANINNVRLVISQEQIVQHDTSSNKSKPCERISITNLNNNNNVSGIMTDDISFPILHELIITDVTVVSMININTVFFANNGKKPQVEMRDIVITEPLKPRHFDDAKSVFLFHQQVVDTREKAEFYKLESLGLVDLKNENMLSVHYKNLIEEVSISKITINDLTSLGLRTDRTGEPLLDVSGVFAKRIIIKETKLSGTSSQLLVHENSVIERLEISNNDVLYDDRECTACQALSSSPRDTAEHGFQIEVRETNQGEIGAEQFSSMAHYAAMELFNQAYLGTFVESMKSFRNLHHSSGQASSSTTYNPLIISGRHQTNTAFWDSVFPSSLEELFSNSSSSSFHKIKDLPHYNFTLLLAANISINNNNVRSYSKFGVKSALFSIELVALGSAGSLTIDDNDAMSDHLASGSITSKLSFYSANLVVALERLREIGTILVLRNKLVAKKDGVLDGVKMRYSRNIGLGRNARGYIVEDNDIDQVVRGLYSAYIQGLTIDEEIYNVSRIILRRNRVKSVIVRTGTRVSIFDAYMQGLVVSREIASKVAGVKILQLREADEVMIEDNNFDLTMETNDSFFNFLVGVQMVDFPSVQQVRHFSMSRNIFMGKGYASQVAGLAYEGQFLFAVSNLTLDSNFVDFTKVRIHPQGRVETNGLNEIIQLSDLIQALKRVEKDNNDTSGSGGGGGDGLFSKVSLKEIDQTLALSFRMTTQYFGLLMLATAGPENIHISNNTFRATPPPSKSASLICTLVSITSTIGINLSPDAKPVSVIIKNNKLELDASTLVSMYVPPSSSSALPMAAPLPEGDISGRFSGGKLSIVELGPFNFTSSASTKFKSIEVMNNQIVSKSVLGENGIATATTTACTIPSKTSLVSFTTLVVLDTFTIANNSINLEFPTKSIFENSNNNNNKLFLEQELIGLAYIRRFAKMAEFLNLDWANTTSENYREHGPTFGLLSNGGENIFFFDKSNSNGKSAVIVIQDNKVNMKNVPSSLAVDSALLSCTKRNLAMLSEIDRTNPPIVGDRFLVGEKPLNYFGDGCFPGDFSIRSNQLHFNATSSKVIIEHETNNNNDPRTISFLKISQNELVGTKMSITANSFKYHHHPLSTTTTSSSATRREAGTRKCLFFEHDEEKSSVPRNLFIHPSSSSSSITLTSNSIDFGSTCAAAAPSSSSSSSSSPSIELAFVSINLVYPHFTSVSPSSLNNNNILVNDVISSRNKLVRLVGNTVFANGAPTKKTAMLKLFFSSSSSSSSSSESQLLLNRQKNGNQPIILDLFANTFSVVDLQNEDGINNNEEQALSIMREKSVQVDFPQSSVVTSTQEGRASISPLKLNASKFLNLFCNRIMTRKTDSPSALAHITNPDFSALLLSSPNNNNNNNDDEALLYSEKFNDITLSPSCNDFHWTRSETRENDTTSNDENNNNNLGVSSNSPVLSLGTTVTQSLALVAAGTAASVVPTLGFGVARQQAMISFVQGIRSGDCQGVKAVDGVAPADSPTQMSIGDSESRYLIGGAVGNVILSLAVVLSAQIAGTLFIKNIAKSPSWSRPFAVFARSHVAMVVFVFGSLLFAPTVKFGLLVAALAMPTYVSNVGEKVLAAGMALALFAAPIVYYCIWSLYLRERKEVYRLYRSKNNNEKKDEGDNNNNKKKEKQKKEEKKKSSSSCLKSTLNYWFEGPGEWQMPRVSNTNNNSNKNTKQQGQQQSSSNNNNNKQQQREEQQRNKNNLDHNKKHGIVTLEHHLEFEAATPMLDGYQGHAFWFGAAEFATQFGLAFASFIAQLVSVEKSCTAEGAVLLVVLTIFLLLCLYFRPFQELLNRVAVPIVTVLEIAVIAVAMLYGADQPEFVVTIALMTASLQSVFAVLTLLASLAPLMKQIIRVVRRFKKKTAKKAEKSSSRRQNHGSGSDTNAPMVFGINLNALLGRNSTEDDTNDINLNREMSSVVPSSSNNRKKSSKSKENSRENDDDYDNDNDHRRRSRNNRNHDHHSTTTRKTSPSYYSSSRQSKTQEEGARSADRQTNYRDSNNNNNNSRLDSRQRRRDDDDVSKRNNRQRHDEDDQRRSRGDSSNSNSNSKNNTNNNERDSNKKRDYYHQDQQKGKEINRATTAVDDDRRRRRDHHHYDSSYSSTRPRTTLSSSRQKHDDEDNVRHRRGGNDDHPHRGNTSSTSRGTRGGGLPSSQQQKTAHPSSSSATTALHQTPQTKSSPSSRGMSSQKFKFEEL